MIKYINADRFEKEMYHDAFETDTDMQRWDSGCWIRYKLFETVLDKQPTADVREKVRGEWLVDKYNAEFCSVCGRHPYNDGEYYVVGWYSDFCPHCGAEMRTNNAPLADDNSIYG